MTKLTPFVAAIDPGTNTGLAIWSRADDRIIHWCKKDFVTAIEFIENTFGGRKGDVRIFVEHPGRFVYARNADMMSSVREDLISKAGGNRREGELLAKMLIAKGFDVRLVPPVRETKWDQKRFELFTRSRKRATQDERDAVRLAVYYANKK